MLRLLVELRVSGLLNAHSVVEIGAQQLSDSFLEDVDGIQSAFEAFGRPRIDLPSARGDRSLRADAPAARVFYEAVGLSYASIDIDGSPSAIPLDLNYDRVPARMRGAFGLVTNFGTTEHIANQLNAFKAAHELAEPGGIMMHEVPAQGSMNHGLFSYHPKFFWALARENDYRWLSFDFSWSHERESLDDATLEELRQYVDVDSREPFSCQEAALVVVLQKRRNTRFRPPIDGPPPLPRWYQLAERATLSFVSALKKNKHGR